MKKIFLRIALALIVLVLLLAIASAIIVARYQNEVKKFVIDKVNDQINTELILAPENIDFTVFSSFPNAAVNIRNIALLDAVKANAQDKDTLLKAGIISFHFSIADLINKKYVVKSLAIKNVNLKVWVNKKGEDNFHFLKASTDTAQSHVKDTTAFSLDKLTFENIHLTYNNKQTNDEDDVTLKHASIKGKFSSSAYTLKTDLELYVKEVKSNGTVYMQHRAIGLKTTLDVNEGRYAIKTADINLEKLGIGIKGTVDVIGNKKVFNLSLEGKNMDIQSALSWMPGKFRKDIEEFNSKGKFYFHTNITGTLDDKHVPEVVVSAGITNGEIKQTKENLDLKNIDLQLEFTNVGKGKVTITNFSGALPEGTIQGNLTMENFADPVLDLSLDGKINLTELQKFLRIDTIESINGKMDLAVNFHGPIRKTAGAYLNEDQTTGDIHFSEVNMKLHNNSMAFENLNGAVHLGHDDVTLKGVSGKISGNDFNVDGYLKNLLPYVLLKNEPLEVNLNLSSKHMDLNEFLSDKTAPASKDNPSYKLNLSKDLDITLSSSIENLKFRKFVADHVVGVFKLKNQVITIDPMNFNTMEGSVVSSIQIDGTRTDSVKVEYLSNLQHVDVTQLFASFENFGQETMTDKNVKGSMTAKIIASIPCGIDLSVNTAKVAATCDLGINNGQFINFAPMKSLSKFVSLKELNDVKFANLKTLINIQNRLITIPQTEVNSSILDLEVSGTQDFDENVDYVFGVYLSELLGKKARDSKKENGDFSETDQVSKHKFRLYLNMKGNMSNPVIKYDHKAARTERKELRKEEKERIKGLLNRKFGWYKSDTLAVKK